MNVTPPQRDLVIRTLFSLFNDWPSRKTVAKAAGLADASLPGDAEAGWTQLVDEAIARGSLPDSLRAASEAAPGDAQIRDMADMAADGALPEAAPAPPAPRPSNVPIIAMAIFTSAIVALCGYLILYTDLFAPDPVPPRVVAAPPSAPMPIETVTDLSTNPVRPPAMPVIEPPVEPEPPVVVRAPAPRPVVDAGPPPPPIVYSSQTSPTSIVPPAPTAIVVGGQAPATPP
jgi:hypothetical protein